MLKPFVTVKKDTKYSINLEEFEQWEGSFFKEIYQKVISSIIEICEFSDSLSKDKKSEELSKFNNLIAFTGERGSGKSSTMFSFINAFEKSIENVLEFGGHNRNYFQNYYFNILDPIDPSLFDERDNILEIVVIKLFRKFKDSLATSLSDADFDYERKRSLLQKFEYAFNCIKTVEKEISYSSEEIIEEISILSYGSNLREALRSLISEYLDFFKKDEKNKLLVIVIDDFDLNINHALEMSELIRKYLFLPNVIILTAMNYDDLFLLIQQDHTEHLELSLKYKQINNLKITDKTFRYLEKFLPYPRRLFLPNIRDSRRYLHIYFDDKEEKDLLELMIKNIVLSDINSYIRAYPVSNKPFPKISIFNEKIDEIINDLFPLSIKKDLLEISEKIYIEVKNFLIEYYGEEDFNKINHIEPNENPNYIASSIREEIIKEISRKFDFKILRLINLKTGLNFFPSFSENNYDNLLPDSLREIRNLIFTLYEMKNIIGNKNIDLYRENITKFKNYFINSWVTKNLSNENKELFNSISSMDSSYRNKIAKEKLYEKFLSKKDEQILSSNNSIISMLYLFRHIKKDENSIPLLFALKYYFSMNNTLSLYEQDYFELASLLDIITIQKNKDSIVKEKNLESYSFVIKPKEVYKRIQSIYFYLFELYEDGNNKDSLISQIEEILNKNSIINSKYRKPFSETSIELLEWLFIFFRFFTRDNPYYFIHRDRYNFFQLFIQLIKIKDDSHSFINNIQEEKEFLLSDLVGLEFYIYSCKDMKKDAHINVYGQDVNWTEYDQSMIKKLNSYKNKYNCAFPIYNLEIFNRILPDENGIEQLIKTEGQYNNFIEGFYNIMYSQFRNVDMEYPTLSYFRNPIFNPFLEGSAKAEFYRVLFNFVFSKEVAYLNPEENK